MPACGSMTTTPSGAAYLVKGVIRILFFPLLRRVFWVKTLTFWSSNGGVSGVTSSLKALLPVLCRLWCHGILKLPTFFRRHGGCHCHRPFDPAFVSSSSPSLMVAQVASVWRMLCHLVGRSSFRWMLCHLYFVRTDALPTGFELVVRMGGCFATSVDLGGCFAAVVLLHLKQMLCR